MWYEWGIAWRNIKIRPVQTLIPALVIGLGIALVLVVAMLAEATQRGIIQASDPFGVLVIGAKGSSQQLVINSMLLQDRPVGNIPFTVYEELEADPERVQLAIPLAFGDNVGGARLIGTNYHFFELRTSAQSEPAFQLAEGRLFSTVEHEADHEEAHEAEGLFEVVLGSKAAKRLGLRVGDQFTTTHGYGEGIASDHHDEAYTVVGVLNPSNTPYDAAVLTQIESIWHVHEVAEDDPLAAYMVGEANSSEQVTAILVLPTSFAAQNQLWQDFYTSTTAQAAFPGQELVGLFDLIHQVQDILTMVSYLVLVMAALTVFLAMYNATLAQEQQIAIMRGLGGSQGTIVRVILFETLLIVLIGILLGRVIGYTVAAFIAHQLAEQSALPIAVRLLPTWELVLVGIPLLVAIMAGMIPAIMAYRVNVVEKLFSV